MATKKKSATKKATSKKKVRLQDLPKKREDLSDEQARNVKGAGGSGSGWIHR
jgi:hypothetical protein